MFILMSTNLFVLSTHAQEKDSNVETDIPELNNRIILESYDVIDDMNILRQEATIDSPTTIQTEVTSFLNGNELPVYTAIEKTHKLRNSLTGEESYLYRVTTFSEVYESDFIANAIIDPKTREDGSISVRSTARAYYEGELEKGGNTFYRISKWEGNYERISNDVRITEPVVWAEAVGETFDGDLIKWTHKEVNILSENKYYSLIPSWADEYVISTVGMGQEGGTHMILMRDSGLKWEFEVRLKYGFEST